MSLVSASEQIMGHSRYFFLKFSTENLQILLECGQTRANVDKLLLSLFFSWWKMAMQGFTQKIVQMMKNEKLFASQGGPIILSQVLILDAWPCNYLSSVNSSRINNS